MNYRLFFSEYIYGNNQEKNAHCNFYICRVVSRFDVSVFPIFYFLINLNPLQIADSVFVGAHFVAEKIYGFRIFKERTIKPVSYTHLDVYKRQRVLYLDGDALKRGDF